MDALLDRAFFESRLGQTFQCEALAEVTLAECNPLAAHAGTVREPFSLIFRGPAGVFLPQKIYTLSNESTEPIQIFLVPVGQDKDGFQYEALFN